MFTRLAHPSRGDPRTDRVLLERDGRLMAHASAAWRDHASGALEVDIILVMAPGVDPLALGQPLLAWAFARGRQFATGQPPERARWFSAWCWRWRDLDSRRARRRGLPAPAPLPPARATQPGRPPAGSAAARRPGGPPGPARALAAHLEGRPGGLPRPLGHARRERGRLRTLPGQRRPAAGAVAGRLGRRRDRGRRRGDRPRGRERRTGRQSGLARFSRGAPAVASPGPGQCARRACPARAAGRRL